MSHNISIKDYVEAAYLHGLCVENLDTGELEPPRDISEVQWIVDKLEHKIAQETNKALQAIEEGLDTVLTRDDFFKAQAVIREYREQLTADKEPKA